MKAFWWKLRFAWTIWRVIRTDELQDSAFRDWSFSWSNACASYPEFSDEDPVDSAESEMSYWE